VGATPNLVLPYPELTETADGPDAFSDLALAVENWAYNRSAPPGARFPAHFWGSGATPPATNNAALRPGDLYHHATMKVMLVFTGQGWRQAAFDTSTGTESGFHIGQLRVHSTLGLQYWDGSGWGPLRVSGLRITSTSDAAAAVGTTPGSTGHGFQNGADGSPRIIMDANEILPLNADGTIADWIAFGGVKLGGVGTPAADNDATNKAYVDPTAWVNIPRASGVGTRDTTFPFGHVAGARLEMNKTLVRMRGILHRGSNLFPNNNTLVGTVGADYRPKYEKYFPCQADGGNLVNLQIDPNGQMLMKAWQTAGGTAPGWFSLDSVVYDVSS
jgi:hypothetical protein